MGIVSFARGGSHRKEFKRPERENYSDEENPIQQVLDYTTKIRDSHVKTKKGTRKSVFIFMWNSRAAPTYDPALSIGL